MGVKDFSREQTRPRRGGVLKNENVRKSDMAREGDGRASQFVKASTRRY